MICKRNRAGSPHLYRIGEPVSRRLMSSGTGTRFHQFHVLQLRSGRQAGDTQMQRDQLKQLKRRDFIAAAATIMTAGAFGALPAPAYAGLIKPTTLQFGPAPLARLDYPLPHVGARLATKEGLRIVALGSSSTKGVGA